MQPSEGDTRVKKFGRPNRAPVCGKEAKRKMLTNLLLTCILIYTIYAQQAAGSRRFLTGLIIGTLLARNGMQGGPAYSAPSSYSQPAHHQQQPLFIIIPGGGKSAYKSKPHVYSPPPPSYDYGHAHYGPHRAARRLSPYLRRRSGSILTRRRPAQVAEFGTMMESPPLPPPPPPTRSRVGIPLEQPARQKLQQLQTVHQESLVEDPKLGWLAQNRAQRQRTNLTSETFAQLRSGLEKSISERGNV